MHGLLLSANIYNTATHLYWISVMSKHSPTLTNTCMGCCLVPISTTQQRTFIEYLSCLNTDQHMHGLLLSANIYNTATHLYWISVMSKHSPTLTNTCMGCCLVPISTTQQRTFIEYLSCLNTDQHMHGLLLSANIYNTATHLYWISVMSNH